MSPFRITVFALLGVGYTTRADAQTKFDATLLWPVDSQITFYAAQPGYFALIGITRDSAVHLLWHDVGDDGFAYLPLHDSGYVRVYFLASSALLDLAGLEHKPSAYTLGQAIASAPVVEGYDRKPQRRFFTLADPDQRDSLTLSRERMTRTADARDALHPMKGPPRVDRGLSGGRYLYCLYENAIGGNVWWCDGVQ